MSNDITNNNFILIFLLFYCQQVCSSAFSSNEWQSNLIAGVVSNLFTYSINDYRRFLPSHLYFLQRSCQISIQSVNSSIDQFLSSLFVTPQLLPESLLHKRIHSQIKQNESSASATFPQFVSLIESINDGNAIVSAHETNFQHIADWEPFYTSYAYTRGIVYDNNCSCALYENCTTQANFININTSTTVQIKGLKMGCTPSESFRVSTLECFYDSSCTNLIYQYTNYINMNESSYILVPILTNTSRFAIDTTIAQLINNLFTEVWETSINYSSYFERCTPSVCSYTYIQTLNSLYTVTLLLGLQGGLSLVLKWICPQLIGVIFKIYQRCKKRTNVVQPMSTTGVESTKFFVTTLQSSITVLEVAPAIITASYAFGHPCL